jgi:purine-cytosine permease-like protein
VVRAALIYLGLASSTRRLAIDTYGTGLDTSAIIPKLNRVQATLIACVLSAALVYFGHFYSAIIDSVSIFLTLLASSIPWITMVAMGHFRRRSYYHPDALQVFNRGQRGGVYWFAHGFNVPAMLVWTVSTTAGLLFASNAWFVGPGSAMVGGLDFGLVAAGIAAAVLYPLSLRLLAEPRDVYAPDTAPAVPTQAAAPSEPIRSIEAVAGDRA